ncbi:Gfo/Idh/MocA family oxidoreductase [Streptomyces sp. B1866]|uniref:Gfo/Idh/MocA family protein n=1 Tax=Streptomyces sp. B1866 TaxID=3075431 RepID=UPI00288E052D|nr:Gfo/Idh/MocA family oxidoreductase [Streptomyces sp. B1866]MDT3397327.1 Gfo/Idh/MocA family oxidoreductase [Streptomyces sp. B1866]
MPGEPPAPPLGSAPAPDPALDRPPVRRFGLVGATGIAERAVLAPAARRDDVLVRAVAASSPERAEAFRARHGLAVAHASYEALLADDRVDAVYVSVHNSAHARWAVAAARAGKHVVVEKPLCLGRREAHAVLRAAADSGVHAVEAVMTADHPWQEAVRALLADGGLGEPREVVTHLVFDLPPGTGYRFRPELGGGALFDTASYWLQALQATVGLDGAVASGRADFDGPGGVDTTFTARLDWPSGLAATLHAGLCGPHRADHEYVLTAGRVRVRGVLRPAAGPFPVNVTVLPDGGPRRVLSFPAADCAAGPPAAYYDTRLAALLRLLDSPPGDHAGTALAARRIALMEDAYRDAYDRWTAARLAQAGLAQAALRQAGLAQARWTADRSAAYR